MESDASPEGLPSGWTVEIKVLGGRKRKFYFDPKSGRKFYSKQQVSRHLETTNGTTEPKELVNAGLSEDKSCSKPGAFGNCETVDVKGETTKQKKEENCKHIYERVSADGLPAGWIKEIRTAKMANKIRKDSFYLDTSSGYVFRSKMDALRYLETGDVYKCATKPQKMSINDISHVEDGLSGDKSFSEPDASENCKTINFVGRITKQERETSCKLVAKNVTERTAADGLPAGWIKEIRTTEVNNRTRKDPHAELGSGKNSSSLPDLAQNCGTIDTKRSISKSMKDGSFNREKSNVIVGVSAEVEGLPPGWIKEIRTRYVKGKIKMDPYYLDSSSGYIFRSKVDALRFLKIGDISKCATKPQKMCFDVNLSVSAVDGKKLEHNSARRQLFPASDSASDSGAIKSETSKETVTDSKTKASSKHENEAPVLARNDSVSTPTCDVLQESISPGSGMVKNSQKISLTHSKRPDNGTSITIPFRSSKRLKGLEPEIKEDPWISERAIRAAMRGDPERGSKKVDSQKALEDKPQIEQSTENTQAKTLEIPYPFDNPAFADPCLEFAVKTLMGALPIEGNLVFDVPSNETCLKLMRMDGKKDYQSSQL